MPGERSYTVLVTGSRDWKGKLLIFNELNNALAWAEEWEYASFTVVHGACIHGGADQDAAEWVSLAENGQYGEIPVYQDPHPAEWERFGKQAGPFRNQQMVDAGAHLVLAFFQDGAGNQGTSDCVRRARSAGREVREFTNAGRRLDPRPEG